MYWNADKTTVEKRVFLELLSFVLEKDEWIIDGNYGSTMELRMTACDTVFLFNLPVEVCLDGAISRIGKGRYDILWIETELDPSFMREIEEFPNKNLPTIYALIDKYKDGKTVVVFKSREEADAFLNGEKL